MNKFGWRKPVNLIIHIQILKKIVKFNRNWYLLYLLFYGTYFFSLQFFKLFYKGLFLFQGFKKWSSFLDYHFERDITEDSYEEIAKLYWMFQHFLFTKYLLLNVLSLHGILPHFLISSV